MSIHLLQASQLVPVGIEDCWNFFCDPANLQELTPPALELRLRREPPARIYPGLIIEYRVRPLLGLRLPWVTEITHVEPMRHFVDEQRAGPYALWHHEHFFKPVDADHTEIRDLVHYALPFGRLGDLVHPFLVAPKLRDIFSYREKAVRHRFGA